MTPTPTDIREWMNQTNKDINFLKRAGRVPGGSGPGGPTTLAALDDVSISAPLDGQILTYDDTIDRWIAADALPEDACFDVTKYGAVADGVTDSTPGIQAAIDACPNWGCVVIPPGEYRMAGYVINRGKSLRVTAYGANMTTNIESRMVDFAGVWDATVNVSAITVGVNSEASGWNATIVLTVSGTMPWKRGDLVKLWGDDVLPDGTSDIPVPPASAARVGQFMSVLSVSANQVILMGSLRDPITTGIRVARLQDVSIIWEGGTFGVTDAYVVNDYNSQGFRLTALKSPVVKDVNIRRTGGPSFSMVSNFRYTLQNCNVSWARNGNDHYGYGVDDNTSEFGIVDRCTFFQPRHGYTSTNSGTTVGQNSPNIHGRTYGTKIVNTLVDSSTSSCFDSHSGGSMITFENCTAINARFGYTLRGNRHRVLNCSTYNCESGVRFSTDSDGGNSFGHVVDGLYCEGITNEVVEAYLRGPSTHPQTGTRETRPSYVRNVISKGMTGRMWSLINATVIADDIVCQFTGNLGANGDLANLDLSYLKGSKHRAEFFEASGGNDNNLYAITDTLSMIEIDGLRVQGFSTMASRLKRIVSAGDSATLRLSNVLLDYKPNIEVHSRTGQAGWVDWKLAVGDGNESANYFRLADGDITSATAVNAIRWCRQPTVIIDVALAASRTLADLPVPTFQGQELIVMNTSAAASGFNLTVNHGTGPKTSLNGNSAKVLSPGQALRLIGNVSSVWRQVSSI